MKRLVHTTLLFMLLCPALVYGQQTCHCKSPASLNMFQLTYVVNGKVKDVDTNFNVRVFNHDSLLCVVQAHSMMMEERTPGEPYERITSLVRFPVIPLDSLPDLTAEIVLGEETFRFDANTWEFQDSLKFYDSFGIFIYKVTAARKFSKAKKNGGVGSFRGDDIPDPAKEDFPFVIIGEKFEEFEMKMPMRKPE